MLVNILVLAIVIVMAYLTIKMERKEIKDWIENDSTEFKENILISIRFWYEVLKKPSRAVAMAIFLIFQPNVYSMIILPIIIFVATYFFAKVNILDSNVEFNQKTLTIAAWCFAIFAILDYSGILSLVLGIIECIGIVICVIAIIYLLVERSRKN